MAADILEPRSLEIGAASIGLAAGLRPRVLISEAILRDADGRVLASVADLALTLSARDLLRDGAVRVQEVTLSDAVIAVGTVPGDGRAEFWPDPRAMAGRLDGALESPALATLRSIRAAGLVLAYDDARGRRWTGTSDGLVLEFDEVMARLSAQGSLAADGVALGRVAVEYESPRGSPAAMARVTLTDAHLSELAAEVPTLGWLAAVDASLSFAATGVVDDAGTLGPIAVALDLAPGQLHLGPGHADAAFDVARADLRYDPSAQAIAIEDAEFRSGLGSGRATGRLYIAATESGVTPALQGQLALADLRLSLPRLLAAPLDIAAASTQARVRFAPFRIEVADLILLDPAASGLGALRLNGGASASPDGWHLAANASLAALSRDRVLGAWPTTTYPALRDWVARNLSTGRLLDVSAAYRQSPREAGATALSARFEDVTVTALPSHPPITGAAGRLSYDAGGLAIAFEEGAVAAPEGGRLDVAGTTLTIPAGRSARPLARIGVAAQGPLTAALSLLDLPPYGFVSAAGQPVDVAAGEVAAIGAVELRLGEPMREGEIRYDIAATLTDVAAMRLVPGHALVADALRASVTPSGLEVSGPLRVGRAAVEGTWRLPFEADPASTIEAVVEIAPPVLADFGIHLPDGAIAGNGRGALSMTFRPGEAPSFELTSDLEGLALSLPQVGWVKAATDTADFIVEGRLASPTRIDRLALEAPDLSAEGSLTLTAEGALDRLALSRLVVGGWLDAPVTLIGRGSGEAPGLVVQGGRVDLRGASFDGGGGGGGGPATVTLDSLRVTDAIALTSFQGEFLTATGLEGTFDAQVNGGPLVSGRVAPQAGRVAARIQAEDAGWVMRAAGLFSRAEGGALDLLLLPDGPEAYDGEAWITGLRVRDAPALASLLNAASVVGLLQQLRGRGIVFDEVSADFRIDPTRVTVARSSAVGAGLGLSLDGTYDTAAGWMDFRGVVSPLYLVNRVGAVLTRPGEGLLGANYALRGDPDAAEVGVNPLSVLAPGMVRSLLRRPARTDERADGP